MSRLNFIIWCVYSAVIFATLFYTSWRDSIFGMSARINKEVQLICDAYLFIQICGERAALKEQGNG